MESGIPVHIIHGSNDPLATVFFARRVQRRLRCKFTLTRAAMTMVWRAVAASLAMLHLVSVDLELWSATYSVR